MYFVYCIYNLEDRSIYIGQTDGLQKRLDRHNGLLSSRITTFTRKHPSNWAYLYVEDIQTRLEALKREKQLKSSNGRSFLKKLLVG